MNVVPIRGRNPGPSAPDRLITDQMALRAWVRRQLQPQATRLAAAYWWPTHRLQDAQVELRLAMLRLLQAAKTGDKLSPSARAFADGVLQEAIEQMGELHDRSFTALEAVAANARRAGASSSLVSAATVKVARGMTPFPPPWMVLQAIEASARPYPATWRHSRPPVSSGCARG